MLDGRLLDALDAVARGVRGRPTDAFGGIQVVLTGDFLQLPPVPPAAAQRSDRPHLAFESTAWDALGLVTVLLRTVFRQGADPAFAALLRELREGRLGAGAERALRGRVGAAAPAGAVVTRLRARNRDADAINRRAFEALDGEARVFRAEDGGGDPAERAALARGCPAAAELALKVGAHVLLVRNLDVAAGLVNGAQGVVVGFRAVRDDRCAGGMLAPVVRFHHGVSCAVPRVTWRVEHRSGVVAASRVQVPLRLAYALTVHRAQGMEFAHLELDCQGIFECGQTYVALSRARTLDGLYLARPVQPHHVRAHPAALAFYRRLLAADPAAAAGPP